MKRHVSTDDLLAGIRGGDRACLSRAITLVESTAAADAPAALALLQRCLPFTGNALRIGVSGVPGAGKSTFLEALGQQLVARGHRLAVLAVDPSSQATGGSILGDKTRMNALAQNPAAYIRPSPSSGHAGGVAPRTREALLLCEAAGFDLVAVETVGAGQSDVTVAAMVDVFVLLLLAGAGDDLQGIKRGIMELADIVVIHKAEGANRDAARRARAECEAALRILHGDEHAWRPPVLTASSISGDGIDAIWQAIESYRALLGADGLRHKRSRQALQWFEAEVQASLQRAFLARAEVAAALPELRRQVLEGTLHPTAAAATLLRLAPHS